MKLSLERIDLAIERTMMAWNRTSSSMITFGFTLYKFFDYLYQDRQPSFSEEIFGARTYGLWIIAISVFTLVVGTWQHLQPLNSLRSNFPAAPMSLSVVLAVLMIDDDLLLGRIVGEKQLNVPETPPVIRRPFELFRFLFLRRCGHQVNRSGRKLSSMLPGILHESQGDQL